MVCLGLFISKRVVTGRGGGDTLQTELPRAKKETGQVGSGVEGGGWNLGEGSFALKAGFDKH